MRHEDLLEGAEYRLEMNSLALHVTRADEADGPTVVKTARLLHEFDHLVRMLGTSYGLVRYSLSSLYLHNFLDAVHRVGPVEQLQQHWREVAGRVPAKMTAEDFDRAYLNDQTPGAIYRAQSCRAAVRMLDGHDLASTSFGQLAAWSEILLRMGGGVGVTRDALHDTLEGVWTTARPGSRLLHIDGRPLRVHDILEYLGVVVEVGYRTQYADTPLDFPDGLDAKTYLRIINVLRHYLPGAVDPGRELMAQETEGLLELALWPPVWPGMTRGEFPSSGVDLVPSYRLHHILQACSDIGWEFSFETGSDTELDIGPRCRELQRRICDRLGWRTPWDISARWVDALADLEANPRDAWVKHYFHHPRSRRTAWSKQLMADCGPAPVSGAMLAGARHYGHIGFPVYLDEATPDRGFLPHPEARWPEADADYRRLDLLLFTASTAAPRPVDWSWLPEVVRMEAVETWERTPLGVDTFRSGDS